MTFRLMTHIRSGSNIHSFPPGCVYSSQFSPVHVFNSEENTGNEMFRDSGVTVCAHVCLFHSEKRVGKVYSKAKSFVDYVRRALLKLELDESKVEPEYHSQQIRIRPIKEV